MRILSMLFAVVEYFDTGALVEGKLWPSSFSTGLPRYRLFMASDWPRRPVAQARCDWKKKKKKKKKTEAEEKKQNEPQSARADSTHKGVN